MASTPWTSRDAEAYKGAVVTAYGWTCHLCGRVIDPELKGKQGLSLDHVVPRSAGGQNTIENLRPAHLSCNSARGDRPIEQYRSLNSDLSHWFFNLEA
ncbi:HNH endonuclease [Glutamicibacter sp. AOP33-2CA-4]|uniref:HNH endonuclease n=1 Tax=Glutamicibacter sp. AOP33-2CA-4 TaxID=3457690 RepID=UPI0040331A71